MPAFWAKSLSIFNKAWLTDKQSNQYKYYQNPCLQTNESNNKAIKNLERLLNEKLKRKQYLQRNLQNKNQISFISDNNDDPCCDSFSFEIIPEHDNFKRQLFQKIQNERLKKKNRHQVKNNTIFFKGNQQKRNTIHSIFGVSLLLTKFSSEINDQISNQQKRESLRYFTGKLDNGFTQSENSSPLLKIIQKADSQAIKQQQQCIEQDQSAELTQQEENQLFPKIKLKEFLSGQTKIGWFGMKVNKNDMKQKTEIQLLNNLNVIRCKSCTCSKCINKNGNIIPLYVQNKAKFISKQQKKLIQDEIIQKIQQEEEEKRIQIEKLMKEKMKQRKKKLNNLKYLSKRNSKISLMSQISQSRKEENCNKIHLDLNQENSQDAGIIELNEALESTPQYSQIENNFSQYSSPISPLKASQFKIQQKNANQVQSQDNNGLEQLSQNDLSSSEYRTSSKSGLYQDLCETKFTQIKIQNMENPIDNNEKKEKKETKYLQMQNKQIKQIQMQNKQIQIKTPSTKKGRTDYTKEGFANYIQNVSKSNQVQNIILSKQQLEKNIQNRENSIPSIKSFKEYKEIKQDNVSFGRQFSYYYNLNLQTLLSAHYKNKITNEFQKKLELKSNTTPTNNNKNKVLLPPINFSKLKSQKLISNKDFQSERLINQFDTCQILQISTDELKHNFWLKPSLQQKAKNFKAQSRFKNYGSNTTKNSNRKQYFENITGQNKNNSLMQSSLCINDQRKSKNIINQQNSIIKNKDLKKVKELKLFDTSKLIQIYSQKIKHI